jgi:hypothetical protein
VSPGLKRIRQSLVLLLLGLVPMFLWLMLVEPAAQPAGRLSPTTAAVLAGLTVGVTVLSLVAYRELTAVRLDAGAPERPMAAIIAMFAVAGAVFSLVVLLYGAGRMM